MLRSLLQSLTGLFRDAPDPEREAALLQAHRERCLNFRMLLGANNRALTTMASIEEALSGPRSFGMDFIRSACTGSTADVYRMVKALCALAPGSYEELQQRHAAIAGRLETLLAAERRTAPGPLVMPFSALRTEHVAVAGSKAAMLGELSTMPDVRVPAGFVVTTSGFAAFMAHQGLQEEIVRRIQTSGGGGLDRLYSLSAALQQLIVSAPLPEALQRDMQSALAELLRTQPQPLRLAVRSSAVGEDASGASFAGQYRSELNVHPDSLCDVYRDVAASLYGATAMSYRLGRGIRDEDVPMCVAVLPMVRCVCGGVAYTGNPLDAKDDTLTLSAVHGLPKAVVDGSDAADTWLVARGASGLNIVHSSHGMQETAYVPSDDEGLDRTALSPDMAGLPALDNDDVLRLARLALKVEEHFAVPQDIEWVLEQDGEFTLLQTRPLHQEAIESPPCALPSAPQEATPAACPPNGEGDATQCTPQSEGSNGGKSGHPPPPPAPSASRRNAPATLYTGGVTASPGAGSGPVHVVRRQADALGFPQGGVIVAPQALPEWAPLLPRASAIVCERGGVTGHLATVAREFGVPALFGCLGASAALADAGEVTVDADAMTVFAGRREVPTENASPARNPMHGSSVYQTLRGAADLIVPLHLLDPAGEDFRPECCTTLHDITRFCHEKAVVEMFDPEKAPPLPDSAAKRLVCGVPMQYWVVDLGGGFTEPVTGPTVELDRIACAPMLALWHGMVFKPWAGPPPVNARGFLSVLAEATANPDLEAGARSAFNERNYFMISRTFCNLHSRFGFHFSIIEAEAGDDPGGNYVSFRFNGGAADRQRRLMRARFVGDVLEERGLRVDIAGDAMLARTENVSRDEVLHLLKVLGYLAVHTRQLDMIMADPVESSRRTGLIRTDLAALPLEASTG